MINNDIPIIKDLVLIGGGHSHVMVLKMLGMDNIPGVRITLLSRESLTPYSGMFPGYVSGHYTFDDINIDLRKLCRFAGARYFNDEVTMLDLQEKRIFSRAHPPIEYDLLSINVGSEPSINAIPGAERFAVPVKPISRFVAHWQKLKGRIRAREGKSRLGVIGGGASGVELVLSAQYALRRLVADQAGAIDELEFHLVTDEQNILTGHNPVVRDRIRKILAKRGVKIHFNFRVSEVCEHEIRNDAADKLQLDEILWITHAGAAPWIAASGLDVNEHGFMIVDDRLRSTSHPNVFGAGDIAAMRDHARPKSGVFAVRQGPPLARNLRGALFGERLRPFVPQRRFLSLISTGDRFAIASRGHLSAQGRWVWHWKDWIDRRYMTKFAELPDMQSAGEPVVPAGLATPEVKKALGDVAMRCGGCGAKVGAGILARVLEELDPPSRKDVVIGLDRADDAAVLEMPEDALILHTVDSFRPMIDDPYLFGMIAANHALGDIYAMGGTPTSALALASLPFGLETKVEDTLRQMMLGAQAVLAAADVILAGGHTGEGAELTLGFAIMGRVQRGRMVRKGGMVPGHDLVLTKALGTGALFAADMRAKAKAPWIDAALCSMQQSSGRAAQCLGAHKVSACTDITGFGLLGHLVEMVEAASVSAELDLDAVPLLDGALEMIAKGHHSSLQPQNLNARVAIANLADVARHPRFPLLFDPQTAGGLLAAIPPEMTEACLAALRALGYDKSCMIGRVTAPDDAAAPITVRASC